MKFNSLSFGCVFQSEFKFIFFSFCQLYMLEHLFHGTHTRWRREAAKNEKTFTFGQKLIRSLSGLSLLLIHSYTKEMSSYVYYYY